MYKSTDIFCAAAIQALGSLRADTLTDSSAIAYVVIDNDHYQLIEASGKYNQRRSLYESYLYNHFGYDETTKVDLVRYLTQGTDILKWQDFINYIPGKEVIVPIDLDGDTVGYVFRGVIER